MMRKLQIFINITTKEYEKYHIYISSNFKIQVEKKVVKNYQQAFPSFSFLSLYFYSLFSLSQIALFSLQNLGASPLKNRFILPTREASPIFIFPFPLYSQNCQLPLACPFGSSFLFGL